MPLEDLTGVSKFIVDLVATNPVGASDPKSQGDDHLRGIKNVLKNTFPNLNGAMTLTAAQLQAIFDLVNAATALATANAIMKRDAAGRAQIAAPSAAADIARKADVDLVDTDLDAHIGATAPHSATSLATANRLALRDASGRLQVAPPSSDSDAANKQYVDGTLVSSYMLFPGGFLVSWGTASTVGAVTTVTFPRAYSAAPGLIATPKQLGGSAVALGVDDITISNFKYIVSAGGINWVAVGPD